MTVVVRSPAYCVWLSYLIFSYIKCPERQDTVVSFSVYAQIVHPTEREPCDELYQITELALITMATTAISEKSRHSRSSNSKNQQVVTRRSVKTAPKLILIPFLLSQETDTKNNVAK